MNKKNQSQLVPVASGTFSEASMIKLILENEGIQAALKDDYMGTIAPHLAAPGGAGSVKVLVLEQDYERALKIVEEIENQRSQ